MNALSKRERQVMDALYQLGEASVSDVQDALGQGLNYNAVRGLLRILHEKGLVVRREDGAKHLFAAAVPKQEAAKSALSSLVQTFFGGSVEEAVVSLLSESDRNLSQSELDRIARMIEEAKRGKV